VREMVWLSGKLPFGDVEEVMARLGRVYCSKSSIWRRCQQWGSRMKELEEQERAKAMALPSLWTVWPQVPADERKRMGVSMDGTMVHVRGEGWKELKVGCIHEVGTELALDSASNERVERACAQENSYTAHLGGPAPFGELLWSEARRRGWEVALDSQVIGDGASWIWNLAALHFGESHQVLDWYHATEHLRDATKLFVDESEPDFERRYQAMETLLFQGNARTLAEALQHADPLEAQHKDTLTREANYFHHHQRRMNYMELREDQWLIGSGSVESEAKQFKHRLTGAGMRWSREGIENLIPIRAAVMGDRFHENWEQARLIPRN